MPMKSSKPRLLIAALTVPLLSPAAESPIYTLEAKFIQMATNGVIEIVANKAVFDRDKPGATVFGPDAEIRSGGRSVVRVDGGKLRFDEAARGLDVMAAPKVVTHAGREAVIRIGTEPPEYFEPGKDGSYRHRTTDEGPGISFKCVMRPAPGGSGNIALETECRVVESEGRQALPGVKLAVGPPILRTREVKAKVAVKSGDWVCLGGLDDGAGQGRGSSAGPLIVLVKVTEGAVP